MNKNVVIIIATFLGMGILIVEHGSRITDLEGLFQRFSKATIPGAPSLEDVIQRNKELLNRIEKLETKIGGLNARLSRVASGGGDVVEDLENNPSEERAESLANEVLDSPEALNRLRDVIREEQDNAREDLWIGRWEQRSEVEQEELRKLGEELNFGGRQSDEVMSAMAKERDEVQAFFEAARKGKSSFPQAREFADKRRVQTDDLVREVLDEDQFDAYTKWRDERSWNSQGR